MIETNLYLPSSLSQSSLWFLRIFAEASFCLVRWLNFSFGVTALVNLRSNFIASFLASQPLNGESPTTLSAFFRKGFI